MAWQPEHWAGEYGFLNGNAAIALVAGLMDKGMAPGSGNGVLVGGAMTSIPAAHAVWGIDRRAGSLQPTWPWPPSAPCYRALCSSSLRGDVYVARRLRPRDWAPSYQRDISSMATQVTIEQPSSA